MSIMYFQVPPRIWCVTLCQSYSRMKQTAEQHVSLALCTPDNIIQSAFNVRKCLSHTRRLLTSSLSENRAAEPVSTSPFPFRFSICSKVPLLFSRFVGVPSYSLPLYPLRDQSPSPSLSAALSDRVSSSASRFRFCAVLGVSINRRSLLSCSLLFTSAVTSMCSTT